MINKKLIYEIDWLIEMIYEESSKLSRKITDPTIFEDRCIKDLAGYISVCESRKKHRNFLTRTVKRYVKEAEERFKKEESIFIESLTLEDDEGNEVVYEPEDVLADVESEVIAKEMTVLLAQDDHRKKVILGNWINGNDNTSDIARLLAQTIGGNVEAHRKYIQRFRKECRDKLATAI